MLRRAIGLGSTVAIAALFGCGSSSTNGDGGDGGGTFSTSVPAGTPLTALTPAQSTQLCTDVDAFQTGTITADSCKVSGLFAAQSLAQTSDPAATDAELSAECTQKSHDCAIPSTDADAGTGACTDFTDVPSTCLATVGDVETCIAEQMKAFEQAFGSLPTCAALTAASLSSAIAILEADGGGAPPPPDSCAQLDATCGGASTAALTHVAFKRRI